MSDLRTIFTEIEKERGELTPDAVVGAACAKDHPLHGRFEWNDGIAGHKFRLLQADKMIRSVTVKRVDAGDETAVRQFHAVRRDGTYQSIDRIMDDPFSRELLLRQAEREWKSLHQRYKHLKEFLLLVQQDVA